MISECTRKCHENIQVRIRGYVGTGHGEWRTSHGEWRSSAKKSRKECDERRCYGQERDDLWTRGKGDGESDSENWGDVRRNWGEAKS